MWPNGPQKAMVASALLAEIGGESDRAALGSRRVHQLADGREDGLDGIVVVLVLALELIELASKGGIGGEQFPQPQTGTQTSGPGRTITWTSYNYLSDIDDTATGENVSFNCGPFAKSWLETTQERSAAGDYVAGMASLRAPASADTFRGAVTPSSSARAAAGALRPRAP